MKAQILKYGALLFTIQLVMSKPYTSGSGKKKQLLYILLDGFRYDYVDRQSPNDLPGFTKFLQEGTRASWMKAIFPTISYPDWTTLVTGLYAESHGIVGNYIYDSENKENFSLFDANTTGKRKWWETAEPIWATATKAGRSTAVILWSRCDIPFNGVTPDYCEPFVKISGPEILRTNVDKAIEKLEEGYDFVMLYNEYADNLGHNSGPETQEMDSGIREIDATILHLLQVLELRDLADSVNIVIVSDHGMVNTAPGSVQRVELDDYLPLDYIEKIVDAGAISNIKVLPGYVDQVYDSAQRIPGVEVYKHEDIPNDYFYKNHKYIHDIIIKANIDTWIMRSHNNDKMLPNRDDSFVYYGAHGFDPNEEKMRAIFFAKGPDFKKGSSIDPIRNVDVYPLLAKLLQVQTNPNNGSLEATASALVTDAPHTSGSCLPSPWVALLSLTSIINIVTSYSRQEFSNFR